MTKRYIVRTLGCKANLYDSQVIEQELQERGWAPLPPSSSSDPANLCIINTCTVTDEADRQSRKLAMKLAQENPGATVVMTGCGAEVDPQGLLEVPGVRFVVGNQNKNQLLELVLKEVDSGNPNAPSIDSDILEPSILGSVQNYKGILSKHPIDREWPPALEAFGDIPPVKVGGFSAKTRSFLKIQEGCNEFCTYCIIPYGRGPSRSLPLKNVIEQIQLLVEQGMKEVVLTGTNLGNYGTEDAPSEKEGLSKLIAAILDHTGLERLRVSSLDPTEITPTVFDLMKRNPRFCPHFHVSLQSPHSRILRLMKRKYGFEEVRDCLNQIAEIPAPVGGAYVGMDLITGFPGETEEEFEWTYQALSSLPWSRLHVFPYSERKGTPATRLPSSVHPSVRARRSKQLSKLSLERLTAHYKKVLTACIENPNLTLDKVLTEGAGNILSGRKPTQKPSWISGHSPNYLRVFLSPDHAISSNQLISVRPFDLMVDSRAADVALVCKPVSHLSH